MLFNKSKTSLITYPTGKGGAYAIPNSVTSIADYAFFNCSGLTSVTIPNSVTSIGDDAFALCTNLTAVTIPNSVTSIVALAFCNSSKLLSATFQGNAPAMGASVFNGTASSFKVYYVDGMTGFTTPTWQGYGYSTSLGVIPQITSTALPTSGRIGSAFSHTCTATGTPSPTFAVTSGALPDGLTISLAGVISGTPTAEGLFVGTISASNGIPPDVSQGFSIDTREYRTLVAGGSNGTVTGGGSWPVNTTATLIARPKPGYTFTGWTGDATGKANPLSVLMNADKTITATFAPDTDGDGISDNDELTIYHTNPNLADSDNDGLSDYQEIFTYHTDPNKWDTDGDGFSDGYEVQTGHSPLIASDSPPLVAESRTAIEFTFPAALGKSYRIEGSPDLATWTTVESGIAGTGTIIQRFYSTRNTPRRYFRVADEAAP